MNETFRIIFGCLEVIVKALIYIMISIKALHGWADQMSNEEKNCRHAVLKQDDICLSELETLKTSIVKVNNDLE